MVTVLVIAAGKGVIAGTSRIPPRTPRTHAQSALSVLVGELLADPDLAHDDVDRWLLQAGLQNLVNAEATTKIGAGRYERTPTRATRRNGTRPKTLATPAGELTARPAGQGWWGRYRSAMARAMRAAVSRSAGL